MTIALYPIDPMAGGMHVYAPEGPFGTAGNFPLPSFKPGQVLIGDGEAEFTYLLLPVPASYTLNQGDFLCWDQSYAAGRVAEIIAAGEYPVGTAVGTFFLGGQVPMLSSTIPGSIPGNIWSFTFQPGVYGIWAQRYGTSLMNLGAINGTGAETLVNANTVSGKIGQLTMASATALTTLSTCSLGTVNNAQLSRTFTGNTTTGSAVITNVNVAKFLTKGMQITGSGFPAVGVSQPGTFILDIQGSTVVVSQLATATATGVTFTALNSQTTGTVISGSKQITGCPAVPGLYPNQIITGTGVVSLTIASIQGVPGNYTINLTTAATAGAAPNIQQITLAAAPNYYEGFLRNPFYTTAL